MPHWKFYDPPPWSWEISWGVLDVHLAARRSRCARNSIGSAGRTSLCARVTGQLGDVVLEDVVLLLGRHLYQSRGYKMGGGGSGAWEEKESKLGRALLSSLKVIVTCITLS